LLWEARNIILYFYALRCLIVFIFAQLKSSDYNKTFNNDARVITYIGGPGAGKTSRMLYDAVLTSRRMWAELRLKYHTYKNNVKEWIAEGNTIKLQEWEEIRDSYEYWITTDCVPCLMTNIPVMVNQQMSTVLTWEHAYQIKRVPYYSVLAFDESGATFLVDDYKDKPLQVSDFFRLERHFGDWYIFLTEQDSENQFIDVRRVVGYNIYMIRQKSVLKPFLLVLLYNLIKTAILYKDGCNRSISAFMDWFKKVINHIGFRKYRCVKEANTQRSGLYEKQRVYKIYLPTYLNCKYDDRTFRQFYKAKDLPIELEIHKNLILDCTEENETTFLRNAELERQAALEEAQKNEALFLADKALNNKELKSQVDLLLSYIESRQKLAKKIADNESVKDMIKSA
jgi:hypothetical protein